MLIKEFRIILPLSVEEYQVAQLWSVAEASKNETGGGEGIEVIKNEPYEKLGIRGQYTLKKYHLASRVPTFLRLLAPKGALEFEEEAHNAYPHCKTVYKNDYMKKNFEISIESWHKPDLGETENVHNLPPNEWKQTEVIYIDIVNDSISSGDYKADEDPTKFTPKAEGRGPLYPDWIEKLKADEKCGKPKMPHMCAYKLVRCHFKKLGFQGIVESFIQRQERRIFQNFHRQVYCWMDKWHGMTMDDIRRVEDKAQEELNDLRRQGSVRGTKNNE